MNNRADSREIRKGDFATVKRTGTTVLVDHITKDREHAIVCFSNDFLHGGTPSFESMRLDDLEAK